MCKKKLGNKIREVRLALNVSTYELQNKGIHPQLSSRIEKGNAGYTIDSLLKYLSAIDEEIEIEIRRKEPTKT